MRKEKVKFDLSGSPLLRLYSLILPSLRLLTSRLIATPQMRITGIPLRPRTEPSYCFSRVTAAHNIDGSMIDKKNRQLTKRMEPCRKLMRALLK